MSSSEVAFNKYDIRTFSSKKREVTEKGNTAQWGEILQLNKLEQTSFNEHISV